jgi:F-type H+-transporting ATPase subunit b
MEFFQQNIHLNEVLVQFVAFTIFFLVLKYFAWKPMLQALEARQSHIRDEFQQIASGKEELAALRAEYQAKLQKIEDEAREKIQEAVSEGKRLAREVQEQARAQAHDILEKAREDITIEAAKARVTLRHEIAGLAFLAAERIVKEKLTNAKDEQMVLAFIEELDKHKEPFAAS